MNTDPGFTVQDAISEICNGVIDAVAELASEPEAARSVRRQTVGHTVMSFRPRDPLEAMLAGQCAALQPSDTEVNASTEPDAAPSTPAIPLHPVSLFGTTGIPSGFLAAEPSVSDPTDSTMQGEQRFRTPQAALAEELV